MLLAEHDNKQNEVRVSFQQRRETRVSKQKCESRVYSTERDLRISEPCVLKLQRKVNIQELKSPHPQKIVVGLFDPPQQI